VTSQRDRSPLLHGTGLMSNAARRQFGFTDDRYEWRRLFYARIRHVSAGPGGGRAGSEAAQGTLGIQWFPGPAGVPPGPQEPRS